MMSDDRVPFQLASNNGTRGFLFVFLSEIEAVREMKVSEEYTREHGPVCILTLNRPDRREYQILASFETVLSLLGWEMKP